jgi:hypothetical protein
MWERIDEQLSDPVIRFNAVALADALREKGYSVTPEQLCRRIPEGKHHIPGKTDPEAEMRVLAAAVKNGLPISMSGTFRRLDLERARTDEDRIPGESMSVPKGGALIPSAEAAAKGGVDNPDPAAEAKANAVDEGKEPPESDRPFEQLRTFVTDAEGHEHGNDGKFAPKGGGGAGGGDDAGTTTSPAAAPAPKPLKLKAQRIRKPRPAPPADPNAPPPAPKVYHRDHLGRFRTKPRPGDDAAQLTLPTKLPTVKKAGKVRPDPTKVPGGGQTWKVRVTNNPEAGYKGRSYVMHSVADGLAEWLSAPCGRPNIEGFHGDKKDGWTNADVLQAVMGKNYGDATIWKEIASATDKKVTGIEDAFKACANPRKTGRGIRDWRDFDLSILQAAHPAFSVLSRPSWLDEAKSDHEAAEYYRDQADRFQKNEGATDEEALPDYGGNDTFQSYNNDGEPPDDDVPF